MLKITITGKVHNVGYRLLLLELADSLLIDRFDARNIRIKGKEAVMVLVDGDEEQLKEFVELVKEEKPENAVVEEIKVEEYTGRIRDIERFRASFNTAQLNKIVQVGLQILDKQDKMLDKQDETIKIIREESEKTRNTLGEKIDNVSEKIDKLDENVSRTGKEVTQEIRDLRTDIRSYLDERLKKIESEIEVIKSKLGIT